MTVPIVDSSYTGIGGDNTAGFRIYDAFFQHKRDHEIPHDPNVMVATGSGDPRAIRPHHRCDSLYINEFR